MHLWRVRREHFRMSTNLGWLPNTNGVTSCFFSLFRLLDDSFGREVVQFALNWRGEKKIKSQRRTHPCYRFSVRKSKRAVGTKTEMTILQNPPINQYNIQHIHTAYTCMYTTHNSPDAGAYDEIVGKGVKTTICKAVHFCRCCCTFMYLIFRCINVFMFKKNYLYVYKKRYL